MSGVFEEKTTGLPEPPPVARTSNDALPLPSTRLASAPNTIACGALLTVKVHVTCGAGAKLSLPAWSALIVQVPAETNVNAPSDVTVHAPGVDEVKDGAKPDDAVAFNIALVPKVGGSGFGSVIVCGPFGVTAFDGADAAPIPAELVAFTVNV